MPFAAFFFIFSYRKNRKEILQILTSFTNGHSEPVNPETLKKVIEQSLDADKAEHIETINLNTHSSSLADYMVIATGSSSRHVGALAEKLRDRLKARGLSEVRVSGLEQCNWVVVDAGDIIIHIFRPEVREFYDIESMWKSPPVSDTVARPRILS